MRMAVTAFGILSSALGPGTAAADACGPRLVVSFFEEASDVFLLHNASDPGWSLLRVEIDLRDAAGGLIFDVTGSGAGVSSYQPYAQTGGTAAIVARTEVNDGDSLMNLAFERFDPGERFMFTIDLDDTRPGPEQTWIDGAELIGGMVRGVFAAPDGREAERSGRFEADGKADTGRHENCLMS